MSLLTEQADYATGEEVPGALAGVNLTPDGSGTPRDIPKKGKDCLVVERPGSELLTWERWLRTPGGEFLPFEGGDKIPPLSERVLAIPSTFLFAWPLWIAKGGNVRELVLMELSGRHLLRKGMEDSLLVIPVCEGEDRRLVLAVAVEEPFSGMGLPEDWRNADRFEMPIHTLGADPSVDLMLWSEWGTLHLAFFRNGKPIWFCGVREGNLGALAKRVALRLIAEQILEHPPVIIAMKGVSGALMGRCALELQQAFPKAGFQKNQLPAMGSDQAPDLSGEAIDLPPLEAIALRQQLQRNSKLLSLVKAVVLLYLILLIWGSGDLMIRHHALKKIRSETALLEPLAKKAKLESEQWQTLRRAIDPATYALDLLSAVATPTEGGKVRLTLFSLEQGRLQLSGEATDVSQAYRFIEQLKSNPLLQEYEWNAGQPQLAGKNSVRFDMEGTRHHAPTGPE